MTSSSLGYMAGFETSCQLVVSWGTAEMSHFPSTDVHPYETVMTELLAPESVRFFTLARVGGAARLHSSRRWSWPEGLVHGDGILSRIAGRPLCLPAPIRSKYLHGCAVLPMSSVEGPNQDRRRRDREIPVLMESSALVHSGPRRRRL